MKRRRLRKVLLVLVAIVAVGAIAGVSRVDERPYATTAAFQKTVADLDAAAATVAVARGPLMAGFGEANLTPNVAGTKDDWRTGTFPGLSLAGASARLDSPAEGVHDQLKVKSIALQVGDRKVVLTALDMLLVPREVTDIVVADLPALGLDRAGLYLGATHTHSGLGGWGGHWTDVLTAGLPRAGVNQWIAQQIEASVKAALADLKPATLAEGWVDIPELILNRTDHAAPVHPGFPLMTFRQTGGRLALFGSYAAHPVILPAENRMISGDYPGAWQRDMEARGYDMAMFMAGPVGGQTIVRPGSDFAAVDAVGKALADTVGAGLSGLTEDANPVLAAIGVPVTLPDLQIRFADLWRVSPWLAKLVLPFRPQTFVQAIRIGNTILLSTPCDYAGELALPLEKKLKAEGLAAAVTSFNGDYVGYVMPSRYDHTPGYETREMALFGPGFGDFAADILDREAAALAK